MVANADVVATRDLVQKACSLTGHGQRNWIHFTNLSHEDRLGCLGMFAQAPWVGTVVASDTTRIRSESILHDPATHYRYVAKHVVERISSRAVELKEPATIYFEDRRNFDLAQFRMYMARAMEKHDPRLDSRYIDPARIFQMPKRRDVNLTIADGLAFSAFKALEPHRVWGSYERAYLTTVLGKLWRGPVSQRNIHLWGMFLRPTDLWGSVFIKDYPWLVELPKT